jgi:hypothetical protein
MRACAAPSATSPMPANGGGSGWKLRTIGECQVMVPP